MDEKNHLLSVIVPVYNEDRTVLSVITQLISLDADKEIIIVNDGSTDNTVEVLKSVQSPLIRIYSHEKNQGKGSAIRTGIKYARGGIIAVQDADLEYSPDELLTLIKPIRSDECDIVFGSRFMRKNPIIYRKFYYGNKLMSLTISLLTFKRITDAYTCYKLFKREVIQSFPLSSRGFEIEAELSVRVARSKYSLKEMPISYNPRKVNEGKKINWKDMIKGISTAVNVSFQCFFMR
ncbi:MAG: glycosyltransferase family 2 protein [bacterium]